MAPPTVLTLLPTCAAAAGCGTSLPAPTPRAPTARPSASSRPPCANGLTHALTIIPSSAPTLYCPGSIPTIITAPIKASAVALLSLASRGTTCCNSTPNPRPLPSREGEQSCWFGIERSREWSDCFWGANDFFLPVPLPAREAVRFSSSFDISNFSPDRTNAPSAFDNTHTIRSSCDPMAMREAQIDALATHLVNGLIDRGAIKPKADVKELIACVVELMSENFEAEAQIDEEADKMAEAEARRDTRLDVTRLRNLIRQRLAEKKNFTL